MNDSPQEERPADTPPKSRIGTMLMVLAIFLGQAAYLSICYVIAWDNTPPASIQARDLWAPVGAKIQVEIRLQREIPPLLRSRNEGVSVTLNEVLKEGEAAEGTIALEAKTNSLGIASFEFEASANAETRIFQARAEVDGIADSAKFGVFTTPTSTPIALVTVDPALIFPPVSETEQSRTDSGRALASLAKDHTIEYLELAPRPDADRTRGWLRFGLPQGPVAHRIVERIDETSAEAKSEVLDIRARGGRVDWALTSDVGALDGFVAAGVKTIYIGTRQIRFADNRQVFAVRSWREAAQILEKR